MILGIGIDHIEVQRIHKRISNEDGFREKLFTPQEIEYCESKKFAAQHYAARFAAKEAFFKALGTGWRNGMAFNEVEVTNNDLGKPELVLHGRTEQVLKEKEITNIQVSLSHTRDFASTIVTLEKL